MAHTPVPSKQDDTAYTPGTDFVSPAGFLGDDVSPDAVNEGDIGAARMRVATRIQYVELADQSGDSAMDDANNALRVNVVSAAAVAPSKVDDAAFSIGVDSVTPVGYLLDDTATDTINEGDVGLARMSPDRIAYSTTPARIVTDTLSAEDDTVVIDCDGLTVVGAEVSVGVDANILAEATVDGSTWNQVYGYWTQDGGNNWSWTNVALPLGIDALSGVWEVAGYKQFRLRSDFWASGSSTVTLRATLGALTERLQVSRAVAVESITPGIGASHLGKKINTAADTTNDVGVAAWGVRRDTLSTLVADGEYTPYFLDSSGHLRAALYTGTRALGQNEDSAHTNADGGIMPLAVRRDANTSLVDADNDYAPLQVNATGALKAALTAEIPAGDQNIGNVDVLSVVPGTGATNLGKAEDGTPGNGDTGVALLGIRQNTPAASGAADGKWAFPFLDRLGQLRVNSNSDRLISGSYAVSTFRTLGSAATPQPLFTIENANGSSVLVVITRVDVTATYTAVLTAVEPYAVLARTTALPTNGTPLTQGLLNTTETANGSVTCRGATASDGGAATAITATAGTTLRQVFIGRIHTAVGEITSKVTADLMVGERLQRPLLLQANQGLLVTIVAAAGGSNAATNHYMVNCEFEVFTSPA